jgi:putative transposase
MNDKKETLKKKTTYRLYPNKTQEGLLWDIFILQKNLYNALIEQRIDAHKRCGVSLNFYDQANELPELKKQLPEYQQINAQSLQNLCKRINRAFDNFFKRVKKGQTPGFPRFKSLHTFPGWGYNTHGDGWKILEVETGKKNTKNKRSGKIRISGVGVVKVRGMSRDLNGIPKTAEITKKGDKWYISVTYAYEKQSLHRKSGNKVTSFDLGTKNFADIVQINSEDSNYKNKNQPQFKTLDKFEELQALQKDLKKTQKILSRKKKGSNRRNKVRKILKNKHEKIANKRKDLLHKISTEIVEESSLISTEKLQIKNMSRSSRGTIKKPGKMIKQKSGLNRNILNHGMGMFAQMIEYKAKEAGILFEVHNTRKLKPTQRCSCCGEITKKTLSDRIHNCNHCGFTLDRDQNAALVMLIESLKNNGLEQAMRGVETWVSAMKCETQTISA